MGSPIWPDWPLNYWWKEEEKKGDPATSRVRTPRCRKTDLAPALDHTYCGTVNHSEARVAAFHVYRDNQNQYRWRFRADNGKIVADSAEGYVQKSDCLHGIDIVKKEAPTAPVRDES